MKHAEIYHQFVLSALHQTFAAHPGSGTFRVMSGHLDVLVGVGLALVVLMIGAWLASLAFGNTGIVDVVWGAGFVVVVLTARIIGDGHDARADLLTAIITLWGLRLSAHLWWRNRGGGEDFRHQLRRRRAGDNFPIKSLATVFLLQGVIMWTVSLPVQLAVTPTGPELGLTAIVGVAVWGVGLFFEAVGDAQLARFRSDPANQGVVMDRGLWRFTRHPNYFGDFCVWWGIWLVAAETTDAWFGIVGPLLMTFMLMRVSGVPVLERNLRERLTGYDRYATCTPTFFPRPAPRSPRSAS